MIQVFKDITVVWEAEHRKAFYDVIQALWTGKAEIVQWDGDVVVIKEKVEEGEENG